MQNTRQWVSAIFPCASIFLLIFSGACSSDNPVCGDGVLNGDEQCDGYDYGGQNCAGLNFNGGHLYCNADCSIDTRTCHNCEEDPCRGVDCSGHGRCINYEESCIALCECDEGYVAAPEGQCAEEGSCKRGGETCESNGECCMGTCHPGSWGEERYCIDSPCLEDSDCVNHGDDGREMYCNHNEFLATDMSNNCIKLPEGISPGDRNGTCGASCIATANSACADGYFCMNRGAEDPTAFCSKNCETDADCQDCVDPENHFADPYCGERIDGSKFCDFDFLPCNASSDCPAEMSCMLTQSEGGDYIGICIAMGGKESGEECIPFTNDDFSYQAWDDRCEAFYCYHNHCNEFCSTDLDCFDGGICSMISGADKPDLLMCLWAPGTRLPCEMDADCDNGEICRGYYDQEGQYTRTCGTPECDPAAADCQDTGESCGPEFPPCRNNFCTSLSYCSHYCKANSDCPPSMICSAWQADEDSLVGWCWKKEGSTAPCETGADCPEGETCRFYTFLYEGTQGVCESYAEDASWLGEACNASEDCASQICVDMEIGKVCSEYCLSDADCPLPYHCVPLEDANGETYAGYCYALSGTGQSCGSQVDCQEGETCTPLGGMDELNTICVDLLPEGAEVGESCSSYTDCKTQLCLGKCSYLCAADDECYPGSLCQAFSYWRYEDLLEACFDFPGSANPCQVDGDCVTEEACSLVVRKLDGQRQFDFACTTRVPMAGRTGQSCSVDTDCYNRMCSGFPLENQCSEICLADTDCPEDMYCSAFAAGESPPDAGHCKPKEGSFTPCTDDGQCSEEGEICRTAFPFNAESTAICTLAIQDGALPGQPCESSHDCRSKFCDGILGICMTPCDDDGDCAAYGLVCGTVEPGTWLSYSACVPE